MYKVKALCREMAVAQGTSPGLSVPGLLRCSFSLSTRPRLFVSGHQRPLTLWQPRHAYRAPTTMALASSGALQLTPASASMGTLAANLVGWLVILGSCVRSLPQILRIARNKSAAGLSISSFVSELVAYIITVAYNYRNGYPFSTWGDVLIVSMQHALLILLTFDYNKELSAKLKAFVLLFLMLGTFFVFSKYCNMSQLALLQAFSVVLLALGGRLPQILLNVRRGDSGELSITSTGLSFLGNVARVFTTLMLVGDPIILASAASQLLLNSILMYQILETIKKSRSDEIVHALP